MKRIRTAKVVAALLAFGLIAAACGDDKTATSTNTGASSGTTASGSTAKATGSGTGTSTAATGSCTAGAPTIKIGVLTQVANYSGIDDGVKAAIDRANKTCVGGRKIEFVGMKDDASDPAKNLAQAQSLVEQDKVFAIIATSAVLLPATTDYLASKKVPFFGWGFMPGFCGKDAWGYGINGCLSAFAMKMSTKTNGSLIEPIATITKKTADTVTLVLLQSDDDAGRFGDLQYSALFSKTQVLSKQFVPTQGTADVTQYVNLVKEKNPDAVMISTDFVSGLKIKAALVAGGYKGIVYDYTTYNPALLADKNSAAALEGGYTMSQFPANEDGTPAMKQFNDDLKASGSKLTESNLGASIGYWGTDLLVQMLNATATAKKDITPDNFRAVAEGGFASTQLAGGPGVVKFPDNHSENVPCSAVVQVKGGKYVSAVPFKCYTLLAAKS